MKLLLLLCLFLPILASADIYSWQDASGKKHFSDKSTVSTAEKLDIKPGLDFFTVKMVYDGDTVVLENGRKIRLLGINTPEVAHRDKLADAGGEEAKTWLINKLKNTRVRLETDVETTDSYGRVLAHLFTENKDHINLQLVQAGLAQANIFPPNLLYANEILAAEQVAETANTGIWQRPEYQVIPVNALPETGHSGWTRIVGKVINVKPARKYIYLEFTPRFSARIERDWLKLFPDVAGYLGKNVELRGWLNKNRERFFMLIRHPGNIKLKT